jgi:hypothetical protein
MAHRYFGSKRNAGWGHSVPWRIRRSLARQCVRARPLWRLGLIDVERDRHRPV